MPNARHGSCDVLLVMNEVSLHRLFRRVLLAAVLVVTTLACGGATTGSGPSGNEMGGQAGGLNPSDPCNAFVGSSCSTCVAVEPGSVKLAGGVLPFQVCQKTCGANVNSCYPIYEQEQVVAMVCEWMGCGVTSGRRPAGLVEPSEARLRDLGSFFAELALLEAASVDAFHVLGDELRHHGVLLSLVRATE